MPRCDFAVGYTTPACKHPTSCGCALDCEKYRIPHSWYCHNDSREDGSRETDLVKLLKSPIIKMTTDGRGNEIDERAPAPSDEDEVKNYIYRNPLECSANCSGIGGCLKQGEDLCE